MRLINKRTQYTVENENNTLKLTGEVSSNEDYKEISMNGSIQDLEGQWLGSFNYRFRKGGNADKSVSQINRDYIDTAEDLLDETMDALLNEFNF